MPSYRVHLFDSPNSPPSGCGANMFSTRIHCISPSPQLLARILSIKRSDPDNNPHSLSFSIPSLSLSLVLSPSLSFHLSLSFSLSPSQSSIDYLESYEKKKFLYILQLFSFDDVLQMDFSIVKSINDFNLITSRFKYNTISSLPVSSTKFEKKKS